MILISFEGKVGTFPDVTQAPTILRNYRRGRVSRAKSSLMGRKQEKGGCGNSSDTGSDNHLRESGHMPSSYGKKTSQSKHSLENRFTFSFCTWNFSGIWMVTRFFYFPFFLSLVASCLTSDSESELAVSSLRNDKTRKVDVENSTGKMNASSNITPDKRWREGNIRKQEYGPKSCSQNAE